MKNSRCYALSSLFMAIILVSTIAVLHVSAAPWQGYVKPAYPDYAPSGMPDFDEKQDGWGPSPGLYTWCGPVAVANSLWWLDSEYESIMFNNPVPPPTYSEHFPLVTNYTSGLDDHDPNNVFPLVPNLAILMDTDGLQTHDGHIGTRWQDLENGTRYYLKQQGLDKYFEVHDSQFPTFLWIENETEVCQDVELFLEFWQYSGGTWYPLTSIPSFEAGHFVTCAGVNSTAGELLISDPYWDNYEAGLVPGRSPVPHGILHLSHNNASYVSQDAYQVAQFPLPPPPPPPGYPVIVYELKGYLQTHGYDATWHTFIRAAVATSPKPVTEWPGYIKPAYPDYAPSGMPDFDEKQDQWGPGQGTYTWCVPVAVANSLWWLDSEFESNMTVSPVPPETISDHFPLVTAYGAWDDHSPSNVDPLVRNLAFLMDTDDQQPPFDGHTGTRWTDIQRGIQQYLIQQGVAGMFEVHNSSFPTFEWIENETELCQDVEVILEFWQLTPEGWQQTITNPSLEFGHCVTSAGVNSTASQLLISDPWQDAYEAGLAPGRSPAVHGYPHGSAMHNDAQYVSQDAYSVGSFTLPPMPLPPPGYPSTVWELQGYLQTMGFDETYHAFVRGAMATSPLEAHDVAVTNLTSAKTVICQGYCGNLTVTVQNQGNFTETFNVTAYANTTSIASQNVTLSSGNSTTITFTWNTTGFAYGNYAISAIADTVPDETDTADNSLTDGWAVITIIGDINGDFKVDIKDLVLVIKHYASYPGHPKWNPNADVNSDGKVDIKDLVLVIKHFGEHYP